MTGGLKEVQEEVTTQFQHISWKRIWVWVVAFFVLLGMCVGVLVSYASSYENKVLPGVSIGDVEIGGMERDALATFLQEMKDKLVDAGITLTFEDETGPQTVWIESSIVSEDFVIELIHMDVQKEVDALVSYQKDGNMLVRGWSALLVRLTSPRLELGSVTLDQDRLKQIVANHLEPFTEEPRDAGVIITDLSPLEYEVTSSSIGVVFSYDDIIGRIVSAWNALTIPEITIQRNVQEPAVTVDDLQTVLDRLPAVIAAGDLVLTYTDQHTKRDDTWTIDTRDIADWLTLERRDEGLAFGLSASSTKAFIVDTIASDIDQQAREARFSIGDGGKVTEFQGSRPGVAVDVDATYAQINEAILQRTWHDEGVASSVPVVVSQVEPQVKTSEVNELGITEILGTGYSNFSGSPTNRVKNIRFAVEEKLHGTLIKPDEEFSLLNALKPFTIEGGYLPELVIKGDEIKPEVGGGLCQIGSTLFRAVMNSGMEVTQRRNHSLVVNYYNDHRNGKPGTDATIYDPAPDFRFKNDTGHYILLTTEMHTDTGELFFTFWGTSDGRKGYYTEPVVHRWIPTGPEKIVETTTLAPGVRNCQSAHPGAETSFTYIRELPNGETEEEVFSSYYRPLPRICLVGASDSTGGGSLCAEGDETCAEPSDSDLLPESGIPEDGGEPTDVLPVEESA